MYIILEIYIILIIIFKISLIICSYVQTINHLFTGQRYGN